MSYSAIFLKFVKLLLIKVPAKGINVKCQNPFQNILPAGRMTHSTRKKKRPKLVCISILNGTFCCLVFYLPFSFPEATVLDLLRDDGPYSNGRSTPETHVALSVDGNALIINSLVCYNLISSNMIIFWYISASKKYVSFAWSIGICKVFDFLRHDLKSEYSMLLFQTYLYKLMLAKLSCPSSYFIILKIRGQTSESAIFFRFKGI